ncbi:hypothetical protein JCGZ_18187 [Jatropha curcas]|uniref:Aminotransferase-like plant mobile domain-containing protein n=1 Tax=Jatropha curcas TaxID=180498 RepID=A0A067KES1_JATCU|nr:hypothetical protein JCGZ_18187 [Jatropha curcas]
MSGPVVVVSRTGCSSGLWRYGLMSTASTRAVRAVILRSGLGGFLATWPTAIILMPARLPEVLEYTQVPAQKYQEICQRFGFARSYIGRLYFEQHELELENRRLRRHQSRQSSASGLITSHLLTNLADRWRNRNTVYLDERTMQDTVTPAYVNWFFTPQ